MAPFTDMYEKDIDDQQESNQLLGAEDSPLGSPGKSRASGASRLGRFRTHAVLGLSVVLLAGIALVSSNHLLKPSTNLLCYEKRYSLDSLWDVVRYRPVQFHLEPDVPSAFRGQPRPELDEAWANVTDGRFILLSPEEMHGLGHSTEGAARQGDGYVALVEVFHYMHCIDFIRKYTFREHYPDWNTLRGPPEGVLGHVDHCIDLLRQKIMCDADIGLMAYSYDAKARFATARTSNMHMCRNFEDIRTWAAGRQWHPDWE